MYTFAYLGMQQIVIILVIALLIFGPQKVPELGRQIGGALRDLKKMSNEVQSAFDLDDHPSYDRYEPPTYDYTPPVSAYSHEPLDQYGLPETSPVPAIESTHSVATQPVEPVVSPAPALSPTIEQAVAQSAPAITTSDTVGTPAEMTGVPETQPLGSIPGTETTTGADADAKSA
jgi:TatA/E family protein of Tat protein translocase